MFVIRLHYGPYARGQYPNFLFSNIRSMVPRLVRRVVDREDDLHDPFKLAADILAWFASALNSKLGPINASKPLSAPQKALARRVVYRDIIVSSCTSLIRLSQYNHSTSVEFAAEMLEMVIRLSMEGCDWEQEFHWAVGGERKRRASL